MCLLKQKKSEIQTGSLLSALETVSLKQLPAWTTRIFDCSRLMSAFVLLVLHIKRLVLNAIVFLLCSQLSVTVTKEEIFIFLKHFRRFIW